ncbi:MAG: heme exporter protein CcmB [Legionellales bacterium]|nr:heme exporter protein CcmB [Legionellales bacterium]|tara:strand:+ start:21701 stop:22372 length:672 start_codon:yes stop_codon:yes gene_type:complete
MLKTLIQQEVLLAARNYSQWLTPLGFMVLVIMVCMISFTNNAAVAADILPALLWVSILLASLLTLPSLFANDAEDGFISHYVLSPYPLLPLVITKVFCHWLVHVLPLCIAAILVAFGLGLIKTTLLTLGLTFLLGTPIVSLLGAMGASLTLAARQSTLLLPILLLPLYLPVLIFALGAIHASELHLAIHGYIAIIVALLLFTSVFASLIATISLKSGVATCSG